MNFRLRGKASDEDARFCRSYCKKHHIPFHYLELDTQNYAKEHQLSVEMAARDLRYNWFNTLLDQHKLDVLAVGHHKNDQAETILMNLIRGTGISGMKGMLPRNGKVIRPLLCLLREEIDAYIEANSLTYCVDESNDDIAIRRNMVRHKILPLIETLNPSFTSGIEDQAQRFRESAEIVADYLKHWRETNLLDGHQIPIDKLFESRGSLSILHGILTDYGFSPSQIKEIHDAHPYRSGARFYTDKYYVLADRSNLIILPMEVKQANAVATECYPNMQSKDLMAFEKMAADDLKSIPADKNLAFLDLETLTLPIRIRTWQQGDKFRPLGMKGFKKVSDFLIDIKLNLAEKEKVKVLLSGDDIVWLVGHRIDDRFKTTDQTRQILKIKLI